MNSIKWNHFIWLTIALGILLGTGTVNFSTFIFEKWTTYALNLSLLICFLFPESKLKLFAFFIFAAFYGISSSSLNHQQFLFPSWRLPGKIIVLSGEVVSFPERIGSRWKWEMKLNQFRMEESEWHSTRGKVEVSVPIQEESPLVGDYLVLKGTIRFPSKKDPGQAWLKSRLFLNHLQAQIRVKKTGDIIFEGWNPWSLPLRVLQMIRESGSLQIRKHYDVKQSMILDALLLGSKMFDPQMRTVFSRTGTSHLLSVSGFHTAVVAGIIFSALILLRFNPAGAVFGAGLVTLAYMALTGWGVAVQRAGMMAIFAWIAWMIGRPQSLLYWLNMALAWILWSDPQKTWDISFQLSFLSMYGIIWVAPHFKKWIKIPGLDISLGAFLATYPLVLFHFQSFSWIGILANLVAVPCFALILPLGFFSLIPGIGFLAVFPAKILLGFTLWILEKTAQPFWSCMTFQQPSWGLILAYYFLGGLVLWFGHRPDALQSSSAS